MVSVSTLCVARLGLIPISETLDSASINIFEEKKEYILDWFAHFVYAFWHNILPLDQVIPLGKRCLINAFDLPAA